MDHFRRADQWRPYQLEATLGLNPGLRFSFSYLWEQVRTGWPQWENEPFDARFQSDEIVLLKKSSKNGKYEVVERLPFLGVSGNEFALGAWF
ncbi:hypothetical protein [Dyadobacter sandarakinus]|uniref:Uncharacterized protein n=1 Tax=Dyadobacter sandarakinus TaxID=2747268 RepID=A0ABX7I5P5_9BACT|nr:hypothetical protein [Dyadobacter sandarakinus]QRR01265.1 hypothetical protein HWI92_10285 [Dyadobacter sandarakinus]